jgi:hypothetical protein
MSITARTPSWENLIAALWWEQKSLCGICGEMTPGPDMVVDHDHVTGLVRGLLCRSCNTREGSHADCADWRSCEVCLWRRQPAVTWVGWTLAYAPPSEPIGHFRPSTKRADGAMIRERTERSLAEAFSAMVSRT